ncbi:hypothetical protein Vadar_008192 [Vaccinium darrowii]|uniref:Uncharacterized protein n=1 Tax=Vaccinium darrowii TaxID=229202 RepID=A0ACB7ZA88_9ERIC|nr:hypothetical protein Vadar_008192 [Vaccinium darrowii]
MKPRRGKPTLESARAAAFKESESLEGSSCIKIEGYDFNQGVYYSELLRSMVSTGLQASNLGDSIGVYNFNQGVYDFNQVSSQQDASRIHKSLELEFRKFGFCSKPSQVFDEEHGVKCIGSA